MLVMTAAAPKSTPKLGRMAPVPAPRQRTCNVPSIYQYTMVNLLIACI
jgi:hypothetical protein